MSEGYELDIRCLDISYWRGMSLDLGGGKIDVGGSDVSYWRGMN